MPVQSPSGNIIQTIFNYNGGESSIDTFSMANSAFTEIDASMRTSITPKFSNSLIIIRFNFLFGGNNSSSITNFRCITSTDSYSSTEVVSSLTTEGSRSFVHGSMRLADSDINDRHTTEICCRHLPGNTTARSYSLQQFTEAATTKYFHATATNNSGCSSQPFTVTLQEVGQ